MTDPRDNHRVIAGGFTDVVRGVPPDAWDNPSPCEGWVARDVVRHLVTWLPAFLKAGTGIDLPKGPSVADDPVAAWMLHCAAVQALLDAPETQGRVLSDPHLGEIPLDQAVDRFYTSDVFMHTWDLARATGQEVHLDPDKCTQLLDGMRLMDEALRASGHFGPRVEVAADADAQTRLMAFIGRTP